MSGVNASVLRVTVVLNYTIQMWSGFRQVACAIGDVTRGACFSRRFIDDYAAAEQSLFTGSKRGRS